MYRLLSVVVAVLLTASVSLGASCNVSAPVQQAPATVVQLPASNLQSNQSVALSQSPTLDTLACSSCQRSASSSVQKQVTTTQNQVAQPTLFAPAPVLATAPVLSATTSSGVVASQSVNIPAQQTVSVPVQTFAAVPVAAVAAAPAKSCLFSGGLLSRIPSARAKPGETKVVQITRTSSR